MVGSMPGNLIVCRFLVGVLHTAHMPVESDTLLDKQQLLKGCN